MKFRDASEVLEIQRLKLLISEMKEKGAKMEAQLLANQKKTENGNGNGNGISMQSMSNKKGKQDRSYTEKNGNEMKKLDEHIKQLNEKIGILQKDIDNMLKELSEKHRNQMELVTIREKIKQLQEHFKNDTYDTKAELLTLKKQLRELEEAEEVNKEKEAEYERNVAVLRSLECEVASLKQNNEEILHHNQEKRRKLAEMQKWIAEKTVLLNKDDVMGEVFKLQLVNQDLSKMVEELQNNRFNDVEELVYLKWVNACLRHELDMYKACKTNPEPFLNRVKESNVKYNDVNMRESSISGALHDGTVRLHADESITSLPDTCDNGNMLNYNDNSDNDNSRPVKIISIPRFTHLCNKRESALSSQLSVHTRSPMYKASESYLIGEGIQVSCNQSIPKENGSQKSSLIAAKSEVGSSRKISFEHFNVATNQKEKWIDPGHSTSYQSTKPTSRSITLLDDYIQSVTADNLSRGTQSSRWFDSRESTMNQKYNFLPMDDHASNKTYLFKGQVDSPGSSACKHITFPKGGLIVSEYSSKGNKKSEPKDQSTYLHSDMYEASRRGQELLTLEWHQRSDGEASSKNRMKQSQFHSPSSKTEFIGDLAQAIQSKAYKSIDDVTVFIEWLDRQVDKEEFLAYSLWPSKKIDAMRRAVNMHEELKSLEGELTGFTADPNTPLDAVLKDVLDLYQRVEKYLHDFVKTRDMIAAQLEKYEIPTNWMLDSGIIEKIKRGCMQVTRKCFERVKDAVLQDHAFIQATRLFIRVHHFTGGLDEETLNAFMELQNKQGLRQVEKNNSHQWNVQKKTQGLLT